VAKAEDAVKKLYDDAQRKAEEVKKEKVLEAKEEVFKIRSEAERENRERRGEIQRNERRIFQREEILDKKSDSLEKRESAIANREAELDGVEASVRALHEQQLHELEKISGLSMEDARNMLLANVERDARHEAAILLRDIEAKTKEEADKRARNIITLAIQRCAADHVAEATVSVVPLPSEDMKGRIIGREGRKSVRWKPRRAWTSLSTTRRSGHPLRVRSGPQGSSSYRA
jgi:ribonuclease Y